MERRESMAIALRAVLDAIESDAWTADDEDERPNGGRIARQALNVPVLSQDAEYYELTCILERILRYCMGVPIIIPPVSEE
jgi:hypothetical protein